MKEEKKRPEVSVVIPVHNTELWLRRCVESVRRQTLENIEIILVENLSADASAEICDAYAEKDSRIRVIHLDRAGLSRARNAGIAVCSAPYVGFVDSDDWVEPDMFELLHEAACAGKSEMAYCDIAMEKEGEAEPVAPLRGVEVRDPDDVIGELMLDRVSASACTKLFDKKLFDRLLFPPDVWFEDHCTVHKWMAMCGSISHVKKVGYHYIQRSGSICHSLDGEKYCHFFRANFDRFVFFRDYHKERACRREENAADGVSEVYDFLAWTCYSQFRAALRCGGVRKEEVAEMRSALAWVSEMSDRFRPVTVARIRQAVRRYRLFYLMHVWLKK